VTAHPGIVVAGLLIALICLLVGAAIGTLLNPPLIRHPGVAMMATLAAVVLAFVTNISPAAAALSQPGGQSNNPLAANWPGLGSVVGAVVLLLVCWTGSLLVAQRRESRFSGPD
jgi:drug/metabolite transporter (DMT)-like permease